MTDTEGWEAYSELAGIGLHWGDNPWRKSKTLSVRQGGSQQAVAYFRDQESYELFDRAIRELLKAGRW